MAWIVKDGFSQLPSWYFSVFILKAQLSLWVAVCLVLRGDGRGGVSDEPVPWKEVWGLLVVTQDWKLPLALPGCYFPMASRAGSPVIIPMDPADSERSMAMSGRAGFTIKKLAHQYPRSALGKQRW